MLPHVPERQTVDYERHGTTTLFAALDMLTGNVIGECRDRHRATDYIAFLKKLDRSCEKGKVSLISISFVSLSLYILSIKLSGIPHLLSVLIIGIPPRWQC
jgi:hypothetical protein